MQGTTDDGTRRCSPNAGRQRRRTTRHEPHAGTTTPRRTVARTRGGRARWPADGPGRARRCGAGWRAPPGRSAERAERPGRGPRSSSERRGSRRGVAGHPLPDGSRAPSARRAAHTAKGGSPSARAVLVPVSGTRTTSSSSSASCGSDQDERALAAAREEKTGLARLLRSALRLGTKVTGRNASREGAPGARGF